MKDAILSQEQILKLMDEQTVFALAVCMMDVHTGTLIKNKNMVANGFMKAGVILRNNAGFAERFKEAQCAIIAEMKKLGPPQKDATPLPTDTALAPSLTILKDMSAVQEEVRAPAPPEDSL